MTTMKSIVAIASIAAAASTAFAGPWIKYGDKPVLGNKRLGTCFDINVVTNGPAPYTMYFSWRPKKSIALVRSDDAMTWTQNPEICLRENPASGWEDLVNRSCTVKKDGVWHLWYTGQCAKEHHKGRIGYARSTDGVHFERVQKDPVLVATEDYEQPTVMCPSVLWDEKRQLWRMWYSAGGTYEPDRNCYAESKDGIHWEKKGVVLTRGPRESWYRDRVAGCEVHPLPDGRFAMFFIGYPDVDTAHIGCAISPDGIRDWKVIDQSPLVIPDPGTWGSSACYKPSAFRDEKHNRWLLWYNGRSGGPEYVGGPRRTRPRGTAGEAARPEGASFHVRAPLQRLRRADCDERLSQRGVGKVPRGQRAALRVPRPRDRADVLLPLVDLPQAPAQGQEGRLARDGVSAEGRLERHGQHDRVSGGTPLSRRALAARSAVPCGQRPFLAGGQGRVAQVGLFKLALHGYVPARRSLGAGRPASLAAR